MFSQSVCLCMFYFVFSSFLKIFLLSFSFSPHFPHYKLTVTQYFSQSSQIIMSNRHFSMNIFHGPNFTMLGVTTVWGRRLKDRPNIITRAETVLVDADPSSESRKTLEQPLRPPPTPWLTRTYEPTMQWRRSASCPTYLLEVGI